VGGVGAAGGTANRLEGVDGEAVMVAMFAVHARKCAGDTGAVVKSLAP